MVKEFSFSYGVTVFFAKGGFFHDEIEIPERVTILVISCLGKLRLSEGRRELVLSMPSVSRFDEVNLAHKQDYC